MNWISNFVRPKVNALFTRRETPDNLWIKCPECGSLLYHSDLADNLMVCSTCDNHMNIDPKARLNALFDGAIYSEIDIPEPVSDPLHFKDQKKYTDRIKVARKKTDVQDAMTVGFGQLGGVKTVIGVQNFDFMGGSMGMYVGNAVIAGAEYAIKEKSPFILFSAAGGARMQEGILSLMQLPRTTVGIQMLKEAGLPYIVVLTHPTTGGVTASYAMLGDIQIAEPNALICFAGPRVIEQTIREKLPNGFQRAEFLLDRGMLDRVTHRKKLREELITIIRMIKNKPRLSIADLPSPSAFEQEQK